MTGTQIWEIAMTLIDEAPLNSVFDVSSTAEYKEKAPYILNALQTELLPYSDYFKTYEVSRKPVTPLLGFNDTYEHNTNDKSYETNGAVSAYYFEVNGGGTVYIEDYTTEWNVLATVTVPNTVTTFTAYSGKVTGTSGATKSRIRFSGSYYYAYTNFALYKENFYSTVPSYRPYIKISMPIDFDMLEEVIVEDDDYINGVDYKFEGKDMYIPYELEGNMRIVYRPILTPITSLTQTLEIDTNICRAVMPYGLGAKIIVNENSAIAEYLEDTYQDLKSLLRKKRPSERTKIVDFYDAKMTF